MNYLCKEKFFSKMADDSFFLIDIDKILNDKLGQKVKYRPSDREVSDFMSDAPVFISF